MNLGQLIGDLLMRAEGGKVQVIQTKRETNAEKIKRALAGGGSMSMHELFEAVGATNRQSFAVCISSLASSGFLKKSGEAHSYRYSLGKGAK